MANTVRYGKPNMTNLPVELARIIFDEFKNAPVTDDRNSDREADEIEARIIEGRQDQ